MQHCWGAMQDDAVTLSLFFNFFCYSGEGQQILETIQLISHSLSLCEKKMKEISDSSSCNRVSQS